MMKCLLAVAFLFVAVAYVSCQTSTKVYIGNSYEDLCSFSQNLNHGNPTEVTSNITFGYPGSPIGLRYDPKTDNIQVLCVEPSFCMLNLSFLYSRLVSTFPAASTSTLCSIVYLEWWLPNQGDHCYTYWVCGGQWDPRQFTVQQQIAKSREVNELKRMSDIETKKALLAL